MKKNFTINEIANEYFGHELNGYSPNQVDHILDLVIEDYQVFEKEIEDLQATIVNYEEIIRTQRDTLSRNHATIDVLKSRLEKYTTKID